MVNQVYESMVFDGITRHSPEGNPLKRLGFQQP